MSENFDEIRKKRGKSKKNIFVGIAIFFVVLMLIGAFSGKSSTNSTSGSSSISSNSSSSSNSQTSAAVAWYPTGYKEVQDGIAFKWEDRACKQYEDGCYTASVIAKDGCPSSLYGEITLEDAQGNSIGLSNDTTSGLAPMQKAFLDFQDIYGNSKQAHLAKISCY